MNFIKNFKRLFNYLAIASIMTLSMSLSAQIKLVGKVLNTNNQPLEGATIQVLNSNYWQSTDKNGNYEFNLPSKNYVLKVTFLGYKSIVKKFYLTKNSSFNFYLNADTENLNEVMVEATRADKSSPFTVTNISKKQLEKRNLGQDIPILLNYLPNVVTTSDAGAGVGYTGIRVRGSDATRVNVTINGIPLNDSESQGTYWVDLPDFVSTIQSIQLQRGVGTSTNGAGAFGASLNLLTDGLSENPSAELDNSFGSFGTHKHTVKFNTGLLNNRFEFAGRLSLIKSNGYVDRATSNLKSFFLTGTYQYNNTMIKAIVFGGHERTYQSWYGIDKQTLQNDRTFNPAGAIYDTNWNVIGFYNNEVDDYQQDHYQLHFNHVFSAKWTSNIAFHYTKGKGYYEEYVQDQNFADYGFAPVTIGGTIISSSDLVRRKWLDNDFYGTTFSLKYNDLSKLKIIIGGAANKYDGGHFGKVISAQFVKLNELNKRYYDNTGIKKDINVFVKTNYQLTNKMNFFTDLQVRNVDYKVHGKLEDNTNFNVDDNLSFFNPKIGVTYNYAKNSKIYLSYAKANKEPNRTDYKYAINTPKPESLDDYELGWNYSTSNLQVNSNLYYMNYTNQLVLTGQVDNVGNFIRANSGKSYRFGLEFDANVKLTDNLSWQPNIAVSTNKNRDYKTDENGVVINKGNTNISYSPNIVIGNAINFKPIKGLSLGFLTKYVGDQYMGNTNFSASKLADYFINDLHFQVKFNSLKFVKSIELNGIINNIFDVKYLSNGYMWGTTPYYYPQAGINFLIGVNLKF